MIAFEKMISKIEEKYRKTKEALKNVAKENDYYNQTTAVLITIKKAQEKETAFYELLGEIYLK